MVLVVVLVFPQDEGDYHIYHLKMQEIALEQVKEYVFHRIAHVLVLTNYLPLYDFGLPILYFLLFRIILRFLENLLRWRGNIPFSPDQFPLIASQRIERF